MGKKLRLPPVFYTLVHFQFNPIAQMAEYVPRLQDQLRRRGYPGFLPETQFTLNIRRAEEAQPDIQNLPIQRWKFTNTQNTEGFLLHADSFVFHTTAYESFADFSQKALDGLKLLHEIVELSFIERIGLRYLDAISPANGDDVDKFFIPSLLGLSARVKGTTLQTFSETLAQTEEGTLVVRAIVGNKGLVLSPDLFPLQLQLLSRFSSLTGKVGTLDIDFFIQKREDFDLEKCAKSLKTAHENVTDAFHSSVTDDAFNAWR